MKKIILRYIIFYGNKYHINIFIYLNINIQYIFHKRPYTHILIKQVDCKITQLLLAYKAVINMMEIYKHL